MEFENVVYRLLFNNYMPIEWSTEMLPHTPREFSTFPEEFSLKIDLNLSVIRLHSRVWVCVTSANPSLSFPMRVICVSFFNLYKIRLIKRLFPLIFLIG